MADSLREHELIDALLSTYLDGELAQDERSRVRRHLAGCDMCQAELDSLRPAVRHPDGHAGVGTAGRLPPRY